MRETVQALRDNLQEYRWCAEVARAIQALDGLLAKASFTFEEAYLPCQEGGKQLLRWEQHTGKV